MIKKTDKQAFGTSFHNIRLVTTPQHLIDILGEPTYNENRGGDKTNMEWVCECNGKVITIYDWKEYREINMDEPIEWHIGGRNSNDTRMALQELRKLV